VLGKAIANAALPRPCTDNEKHSHTYTVGLPPPPPGSPLTRDEIVDGLAAVAPKVQACHSPGPFGATAFVHLTIAADGSVAVHEVASPLAGTPTASCVMAAVAGAHFRATPTSLEVTYPFPLLPDGP
jgi:hypothetical protein